MSIAEQELLAAIEAAEAATTNSYRTYQPLLSPEMVADWLDIPEAQVLRLVQQREIPFVRIGDQIRFRRQDIELAITAHHSPAGFEIGKLPAELD